MKISAVVPVYGTPNSLKELCERLVNVFKKIDCEYEIILVNDSCPKNSWAEIKKLQTIFPHIVGVNFTRNFGQHAAISAGLHISTGNWITILDCDLQDAPEYISEMLTEARKGFDVVLARRLSRKESFAKQAQSWGFYKLLSLFLGVKLNHQIGNYGLYSRQVIEEVNKLNDQNRFFPYLVSWLGFSTSHIEVTQQLRTEGASSYTFKKALKLALDVSISSSNRPLVWSIQLGAICALSAFALAIYFSVRFFTIGLAPSGWTSLIVTILFSTGIILLNLGVVCLYLSRTYDQTKQRPIYIVKEQINT